MSSTATLVSVFNNQLKDLLALLHRRFPEDRNISKTQGEVEISIALSPRTTISTFMQSARPYLQQILDKDSTFFLNLAASDSDLQALNISEKWSSIPQSDQQEIWKKVQRMVVSGSKVLDE